MFDGKTFLGATGIPIENRERVRTRFEVWLPEPLIVAAWKVKSLTTGSRFPATSSVASARAIK